MSTNEQASDASRSDVSSHGSMERGGEAHPSAEATGAPVPCRKRRPRIVDGPCDPDPRRNCNPDVSPEQFDLDFRQWTSEIADWAQDVYVLKDKAGEDERKKFMDRLSEASRRYCRELEKLHKEHYKCFSTTSDTSAARDATEDPPIFSGVSSPPSPPFAA